LGDGRQLIHRERLAGANGSVVVKSVTPDATAMPVYNLDVEDDHRYLVSNSDVLAHNVDPSCNDPAWLQRVKAGRASDKSRESEYDYNQVYFEGKTTDHLKLDSFNSETGEILSRKLNDLSQVSKKAALSYINEIERKNALGTKISDVPSNRDIAGRTHKGQMYLKVPVQKNGVPQVIVDAARKASVLIRDIDGWIY